MLFFAVKTLAFLKAEFFRCFDLQVHQVQYVPSQSTMYIWLVVEPTNPFEKYAQVKMGSSIPKVRGEK